MTMPEVSLMESNDSPRYILRVMAVLKSFTPDDLELRTTEISRKVGIPITTTHRMLSVLTKGGLLERNVETGKYAIGPGLYAVGSLYLNTTDLLKAAEPATKTLNELTGEAINVGIFDKGNIVYVLREETKHAFRFAYHIGTVVPAYTSAMGKALLGELTDAGIDSLYPEEKLRPLTKKTIASKMELKLELKKIRKTGISISKEGSWDGVEGVGSVIRNAAGKAVAAVSIAVPVFRMNQAKRKQLATLIKSGASLISYRLGYQDMDNDIHNVQQLRSWWEHNQLDLASSANSLTQKTPISRNSAVKER